MGQLGAGRARLSSPDPAAGWSRLHHGLDPRGNRLLWWWLRAMWVLARPLAALRVSPLLVTAAGVGLAVVAVVARSPWLALLLVLASVLCDGLDGAVAVLRDRATGAGALADKVADRLADVAIVLVLLRLGASVLLVVLAIGGVLSVELVREVLGGHARQTITVGERPSRVVCVVIGCVCAGVDSATWPLTVCTAVLGCLSVIAIAQLTTGARAS